MKIKKAVFLIILILLAAATVITITRKDLLTCLKTHFRIAEGGEHIDYYKGILRDSPGDYDALWNLARLYSKKGLHEDNERRAEGYLKAAIEYAGRAIEVNGKGFEGHLYLAESLGIILQYEGPVGRVRAVRKIKREAEQAIKLNPDNYRGYLVLGMWHRLVNEATWLEKKLAAVFLGGLPKASLKEAEKNFKKSIELKPDFPKSHYELALVYMKLNKKESAVEELKKALSCPITSKKEKELEEEAIRLLREYN